MPRARAVGVSHVDARRQSAPGAMPAGRGAAGGWDGGGRGSTLGLAGCSAFGSHIALVANATHRRRPEGSRSTGWSPRSIAAGSSTPGWSRQQIEGGLIWALALATVPAPEWVAGMPRSRALGAIGLPRIGDTPEIMSSCIPGNEPPGGVSGLGTTVLAPAVANAIYAATGKRLRDAAVRPDGGRMTARNHPRCPIPESAFCSSTSALPTRPSAGGPALSRRVPDRPAGDRNSGDRVEADPPRHHPAHPADEIGAGLSARSGPTRARR